MNLESLITLCLSPPSLTLLQCSALSISQVPDLLELLMSSQPSRASYERSAPWHPKCFDPCASRIGLVGLLLFGFVVAHFPLTRLDPSQRNGDGWRFKKTENPLETSQNGKKLIDLFEEDLECTCWAQSFFFVAHLIQSPRR